MSVPAGRASEEEQVGSSLELIDSSYDVPDSELITKEVNEVPTSSSTANEEDVLIDGQYPREYIATGNDSTPRLKQKRRTLGSQSQKKKRIEDVLVDLPGAVESTTAKISSKGSKVFTPERDQELRLAVEKFGPKWEAVKEYLKYPGVEKEQYQKRYAAYLAPELENRQRTPWTVEAEKQLTDLVLHNTELNRKGKESINWKKISKIMNRQYFDCQNRWNTLRKGNLIVGRFTAEEDELIIRTHNEWPGAGKGLWVKLEKMLNRRNDVIRKRYNLLVAKAAKAQNEPPPAEI